MDGVVEEGLIARLSVCGTAKDEALTRRTPIPVPAVTVVTTGTEGL